MLEKSHPLPSSGQLSVLTSLIALGYTLDHFLNLPVRIVETRLLGSAIKFHVSGETIALLLVTAIIITGCDNLVRSHPRLHLDDAGTKLAIHWVVPVIGAIVVGMMLTGSSTGSEWWIRLVIGVIFLVLLLVFEYLVVDSTMASFLATRWGLTMLIYLTTLCLFNSVIGNAGHGPFLPLVVVVVFGLIAFRLLVLHGVSYRQSGINGLVVGLMLGEFTLVLGYWTTPPLAVGMLLLTMLHLATGLIQNSIKQSFPQRILLEYGLVGAIAIGTVFVFVMPL